MDWMVVTMEIEMSMVTVMMSMKMIAILMPPRQPRLVHLKYSVKHRPQTRGILSQQLTLLLEMMKKVTHELMTNYPQIGMLKMFWTRIVETVTPMVQNKMVMMITMMTINPILRMMTLMCAVQNQTIMLTTSSSRVQMVS